MENIGKEDEERKGWRGNYRRGLERVDRGFGRRRVEGGK